MGLKPIGIVLVIVGAVLLGYQTFSYKKKDELFRIGDARVTATTTHTVNVPIWVGFAVVAAGIVMIVAGKKR